MTTPILPTLVRPVLDEGENGPWAHKSLPILDPLVHWSSRSACTLKEHGCERDDHFDLSPVVEFFKDGALVLTLFPAQVSRDNALASARIAGGLTLPDIIVATLDAHVTQAMNNPATGKPWGPNEMQNACDDDGACATGLLTDCLVTMAVFKDGHHEMLQRRYRGHETKGNLVWLGQGETFNSNGSSVTSRGYVQDHLMQSMQMAHAGGAQLGAAFAGAENLSEHLRYWHAVIAGAKLALLSGAAQGALIGAPDDEIRALCEQSTSPEALQEAQDGPLGALALLVALKLGVE